ncbi:MFS transporter [Bacillus altitudinis]|uniref:MFS transporter n=1 Tax=Bacillus altitudinis TaxID=293387 RepID=UPI001B810947|nr:MFS transporter [Bacillus altitudinis]MBR0579006.1 MFS transporter [Bacillus altitudinis A23-8]
MIAILKQPRFLTFCLAQLISRFGDGLTTIVILYIVGTTSDDPLLIGFVLFCQYSPMFFFGLIGGVAADHFKKHHIMIAADLFRALILIGMIFSINHPVYVIILVFLSGIGSAFFYPARSSYIPVVVGEKNITEAMGVSQSIYSVMQIAGPGIAGLLLLFFSPTILLVIDILSYSLSACLILLTAVLVKKKNKKEEEVSSSFKEKQWTAIKLGLKVVFQSAPLAFLIILLTQVMFIAGIFNTTSNSILLHEFKVTGFHFGMIEAFSGIGAVIGSILGPYLLGKLKPGYILITTTIIMGLWMMAILPIEFFETLFGLPPVYLWMFGIGLMNAFLNVPISSLFLGLTPNAYRGRAMSILQMFSNLGIILGLIIAGIFSKYIGVIWITAISGGVLIAISLFSMRMKGFSALLTVTRKNKDKPSVAQLEV